MSADIVYVKILSTQYVVYNVHSYCITRNMLCQDKKHRKNKFVLEIPQIRFNSKTSLRCIQNAQTNFKKTCIYFCFYT